VSATDAPETVAAEEAALVARIAAGGDVGEPVAELHRRYGRRLFRFGLKHLGNEGLAQEMVQETFVRLWRTAGRFDAGKASVGTYLYVLARSAAADIYKRPSSRPLISAAELDEAMPMADSVDQILDSMIIREALESIGPNQAEVIRLAHEEGLTQSEIAKRLNVPLGTVKTRTFHGMRALHTALVERGFHGV
jgi:RNA polymerase sigma-70 factor (ECF subfamily)